VLRIAGRDTRQGVMAADYLAKRWSDHNIAIVHDGGAYGLGVAEAARQRLSELGLRKVTFLAIEPGQTDYFDLIDQLRAKNIDVLFFGGYYAEAGLIIRQARSHGYGIRMIGPDTLNTEFFWRVAGEASEGVLFPSNPELRKSPTRRRWSRNSGRRAMSRRESRFRPTPRCRSGPKRSRKQGRWS
jgi:branched-chain amino acid transport system substrate-binding protein